MGKNYYLAVDIGASSGRHMLSHMENGKNDLRRDLPFPQWDGGKKWS